MHYHARPVRALGLVVAICVLAATASATPTRDALIRPGQGIGKINLGMTLAQARATLGRPTSTVRRVELSFGGEYVELQWGAQGEWTVGFRTDLRGALRAVRVETTKTTQRTRQGIGIGSHPHAIVAAFPRATCVIRRYFGVAFPGTWVVVPHSYGRMTAFSLEEHARGYQKPVTHEVLQVLVQERWFSQPTEIPCPSGWQRW